MKRYLKKVDYPMLRGMEIAVIGRKYGQVRERGDGKVERMLPLNTPVVELRYHKIADLFSFECFFQYEKDLPEFMGTWRHLYVRIVYPERATAIYYFAPIGFSIRAWDLFKRYWMLPARWIYKSGYLEHSEGEVVPFFWFARIRFRRQVRK